MRIPPLVQRLLPVDLLGRLQRVGLEERLDRAARTATSGTGEYEIFEFDLGSTFNYAEMAALIAPRPFMVERGHFDGVAPDEGVAYEFAKVRHLYTASSASATAARSSGSTARTRSTASGRSTSCTST